jgi:hypothetical protein
MFIIMQRSSLPTYSPILGQTSFELRNIMPHRGTKVLKHEAKNKRVSVHASIYIS